MEVSGCCGTKLKLPSPVWPPKGSREIEIWRLRKHAEATALSAHVKLSLVVFLQNHWDKAIGADSIQCPTLSRADFMLDG